MRMLAVCLVLGVSSLVATAQMAMGGSDSGPAVGTIAAPSKAVDSHPQLAVEDNRHSVKKPKSFLGRRA